MNRPGRLILLVGAGLLVAHLAAMEVFRKPSGRVVFGDATHHFVQLRSMVFDRDLHFQNEYTRIYALQGGEAGTEWVTDELTVTGHVRNYMPVGPALLWMPLYLIAAAVKLVGSGLHLTAAPDGFDRSLQLAPGITGVLAATAAAWFGFLTVRRYFDDRTSIAAVLGIWIGSHALYYALVSPAYSHSASMLATSWFTWHWLGTRARPNLRRFAEWGALAGFAALMRWQDVLWVAIPLVEAMRWAAPPARRLSAAGLTVLACGAAFLPQMVVWNTLYGQPLALPQGASFMRWTSPHPWLVLFSDNHGLFTWAPLLLLAMLGLARLLGRHSELAGPVSVVVLTAWYTNAAVADWWAGEAFGARRFLSLFPFFVLGLAAWLAAGRTPGSRWWRDVTVAGFAAANLLLLLQYQLFMKGQTAIAPYPEFWMEMFVTRFVVPFRLLGWWL